MINDFDSKIKNGLHLVDFYATWCGPCKIMADVLDNIDEKIDIIRIDTDQNPKLVFKYRIMSIPTILLIKNGLVLKEITGVITKEELEGIIKENKD